MSCEASSARRMNFCSTRHRPLDVQHVQPALEHVDERAQLVVGRHQFAGLGDRLQRQLALAGRLRDELEFHGDDLSVGGRLDVLLGDDFHLARRRLEEHAHGDFAIDVAVDADLPA